MSGQQRRLQTLCTLTETREKTNLNACRCTQNEYEILCVKKPLFDLRLQNVVCTKHTRQSVCFKENDEADQQKKNGEKQRQVKSCKRTFDLRNMDPLQFHI